MRGYVKVKELLHRWRVRFARSAIILVYHHIGDLPSDPWGLAVTAERFEDHLRVLRRHFHPLSLEELTRVLENQSIPRRSVVVTFDDGYANNLHVAKPLLERYAIPATIFITTGSIGQSYEFWWDELDRILLQPSTLPDRLQLRVHGELHDWPLGGAARYVEQESLRHRRWRAWEPPPTARHYLYSTLWKLLQRASEAERVDVLQALSSWAGLNRYARPTHRSLNLHELQTLAEENLLGIGAHSVSHRSLSNLSVYEQHEEMFCSKQFLDQTLKQPVTAFAYPYGKRSDYTSETRSIAQKVGYTTACSNVSGLVRAHVDPYELPRVHVHDWNADEFAGHLAYTFCRQQ